MGPLAVEGSTTLPDCVITTDPRATSLRAASRTGSMSGRQSSGAMARATSLGQIDASRLRALSISMMTRSSCSSAGPGRRDLHASEQYRTESQLRSHDLRHVIVRPHVEQVLLGTDPPTAPCGERPRLVRLMVGASMGCTPTPFPP